MATQIIESELRHHKRPGTKVFALECRYAGPPSAMLLKSREWHVWKKYESEKGRDTAMLQLAKKYFNWEFRVPTESLKIERV